MMAMILELDKTIFLFCNNTITHPVLDWFFVLITNGRTWIAPAIITATIFIFKQKKAAILPLLLMMATVALSDPVGNYVLKPWVHRLRPCNPDALVEGGRFLLGNKWSYSFPSQHSMNMFAQATLLTFFYPRNYLYFFGFAAVIGYSRIYVGVHYPLDVLGGAVFGMVSGGLIFALYQLIQQTVIRNNLKKKELSHERA